MRQGPNPGGGYTPEGEFPPINPPQGGSGVIMADVFGAAVLKLKPETERVMRVLLDYEALERGEDIGCKIPHGAKVGDTIIFARK